MHLFISLFYISFEALLIVGFFPFTGLRKFQISYKSLYILLFYRNQKTQNMNWLVGFYGISTLAGYLMPNPVHTCYNL